MSNTIEIKTEELKSSFLLFDCSGKYSGSNTGGYGIPNYRSEDIVAYTIGIQTPSDTESYPHSINVLDSLPDDDDTGYEVQPSQVGASEIESGLWKFKAAVTFTTRHNGQKTVYGYHSAVFTKNVACCINGKSLTLTDAALTDSRQKKIMELSNLLETITKEDGMIDQGLYDKANTTIEYLKAQCNCPGC